MTTTAIVGLNRTQRVLSMSAASLFFAAASYLSVKGAYSRGGGWAHLDVALAFSAMALGAEAFKATLAPVMLGKGYGFKIRSLATVLFFVCLAFASLNALSFANSGNTENRMEATNQNKNIAAHETERARLADKATNAKNLSERKAAEADLKALREVGSPSTYVMPNPAAAWLNEVLGWNVAKVENAMSAIAIVLLELGSALGFTLAHGGTAKGAAPAAPVVPVKLVVASNPVLDYLKAHNGQTFVQRTAAADLGMNLTELHRELHALSEAGSIQLTTTKTGTTVSVS
jgi:hypothetical protein